MSLIVILFSLIIEHFFGSLEELRRFGWFDYFTAWIRGRLPAGGLWDGPLGVVIVVGLPVLAVALVGWALAEIWIVLGFLFSVAVLLYCFGPRDLEGEVEAYMDARERSDEESARWHATNLLGQEVPEDAAVRTQKIMETVLVQGHERILAIIFWFLLLGPLGALLYRLSRELEDQFHEEELGFGGYARRLNNILAWLPARLCGLSYALAGSFVDAMFYWRQEATKWLDENRGILVTTGFGALCFDPKSDDNSPEDEVDNVREAMALVRRAVLVWLSLLALLTLSGWNI